MKKIYCYTLLLILFLQVNVSRASHVPGGNLTYSCVGNNQYFVKLTLFEDCSTGFGLGNSVTITARCNGTNLTFTLPRTSGPTEVSQLCTSQMSSSSCNGGSLPGVEMSTFAGNITLPFACDSWTLGYSLCCRNTSTNVSGQPSLYIETKLNNLDDPCNNSPYVTAQPIPYVCLNQPVSYNLGVVDVDGDSLSFELVSALDGPGLPVTYLAGYSATQPIPGTTINSQSGQLNFTPNATGSYIFAIKINEYDSDGNILSSIIHDFRFEVIACVNQTPAASGSGISNFTGTAKITGPNTIEGCPGDNFCFNITFNDLNLLDTLIISSNVTSVLPGATYTVSGGSNPKTANVCYTIPANASGVFPFTFTARDNACPVYGQATMAVTLKVIEGISAGPNHTICSGQSAQLSAVGGTAFTWTVLSGPPMVVGTNFSCNNCQNPVASPTATTVYKVTGNLSTNCINTDTVTVFVEPDFPVSITPANSTICQNQAIQLTTVTPGSIAYSYAWSPVTGLSSSTIANPLASPLVTTTYTVNVTSPGGCVKKTTSIVNVNGIGPTVTITDDTTICLGQSVPLNSTISLQPGACGVNTTPCAGTTVGGTVGTGTLNTDYGGPYYAHSTVGHTHPLRHQYIYTVAELQAAGFTSGVTITEIAVDLSTATASTFQDFRIKMGCTSVNTYPDGNFIPGLQTVYSNTVHNVPAAAGWQVIPLQAPYDWDGVSNLVVEFCSAGSPLNSARVNYTSSSPYYRAIYDYKETGGCNEPIGTRNYMRINMKFTACQRQIGTPTYSWTPTAGLSDPTIPNPVATPATSTTYVLNVTDGATGCIGSASVYIGVGPDYTVTTTPDLSICYGSTTQLETTPSVAGTYTYTWSPAAGLSSTTVSNPTASSGITTQYAVSVSNGNCIRRDTVTVNVYGIPITATASSDTVCPGTQVQLDITSYPSSCGLNPVGCTGNTVLSEVGNGSFSSSLYSPFYGSQEDARIQYLYKANDLLSAGMTPGTITSIAFNVLSKSSAAPFSNFTVKIGCTSATNHTTAAWLATAGVVYGPATYTTAIGWNTINLTTPFNWDGTSNIVIEVCFDNNISVGADMIEYSSPVGYYGTLRNSASMSAGCNLSPMFRYTVYPNIKFGVCNNSLPANATYLWTPGAGLSNPNISNPIATVNYDITYTVNVSDPNLPGCNSVASVSLAVDPLNHLEVTADTSICPGASTQIGVTFFGPPPVSSIPCGANNTSCSGPINTITVGNGSASNGTTTYPAVYGNYYWGAKHQILYRASELLAMGMQSGTISQIGFNVASMAGTTDYENVVIKFGCTSQNALSNWVSGLTTVYTAPVVTIGTGWNMHALNSSFDWDGVSNLVVEFCFNNSSYISNMSTYYTPTTFNSVLYYRADNSSVCGSSAFASTSMNRPNTIFKICNAPPAALAYSWAPATTLSDATITNPVATPTSTTTYVVTVTGAKCDLTDSVIVSITPANATFSYSDPFCNNGTNPVPFFAAGAGPGLFSSAPSGLSFLSTATGEINLAGSSPGSYVVTNSIAGSAGCPGDVKTDTVVIRAVPTVSVSSFTSCPGSTVSVPAFTSAPSGATFTWTNDNPSIGLAASGSGNIPSFTAVNSDTVSKTATIAVVPMLNGCQGTPSTFTITIKPAPSMTGSSSTHCSGVTVPATIFTSSPAGSTYSWTNSNTSIGLNSSGTGNVPSFVATNSGSSPISGIVTVTPSLNGCTGSTVNFTVTVNPSDNASFSYSSSTFCQSGTNPVPVISGVPGGTFSSATGLTINSASGEIDLASSTLGSYTISYITSASCPDTATFPVSITNSALATFNYASPYCKNGSNAIPVFASGASAGVFSASGSGLVFVSSSTGEINLSASAPGSYVITNTISASGGCTASTATDTVTVKPVPSVLVTNNSACAGVIVPQNIINSTPSGATFAWTNSNTAIGLPSAGSGNVPSFTATNSSASSISATITITPTLNGCSGPATPYTFTVNPQDNATFSYSASGYCSSSGPVVPLVAGTAGGVFSTGSGLTLNSSSGEITPSSSSAGNYVVSYITNGTCADTSSFAIAINNAVNAMFDFAGPYCQSGTDPSPTFIGGGTAGTFTASSSNIIINSSTGVVDLSASTPGLYTITNTVAGSGACPSSSIQDTLRIRPVPTMSMSNITQCAGTTIQPVAFTSSPAGSSFTWTNSNASIGLASSGSGDIQSFLATNSGTSQAVGNIQVIPTLNGCSGSASTFSIAVDPQDDPLFSYSSTAYCQTGSDPIAMIAGTLGGSFSASPALVINSASGEIDLSASNTGSYTVTYSTTGVCAASSTFTVAINSTNDATFSLNNAYCKDAASNPVPVFTSGTAGTFSSSPSGLSLNSSTGEINLASSSGGTYLITNSIPASAGCVADTHSTSVRIDEIPVSVAGSDLALCSGVAGILGGSSTTGYSYSWSPSTGLSNATISNPSVSIVNTGSSNIVTNYTVQTINGTCSTSDVVEVTIAKQITSSAGVLQQPTCAASCNGQIGVIANGGYSTAYTYSWSYGSTSAFNGNVCAGNYFVTVKDDLGCEVTSNTITVTDPSPFTSVPASSSAYCNQNNGSASVSVSGGTGSITYSWISTSQNTSSVSNLAPGTYIVEYRDQNNCIGTDTIIIGNIPGPQATITTKVPVKCFGGNDGSLTATFNGGTAPFTTSWSNGQTSLAINNLVTGYYCFEITDSAGCIYSVCDSITQPTVTTVTASADTTICKGTAAVLSASGGGGNGPGFNYSWSPSTGLNTTSGSSVNATPSASITYTVTATDTRGCVSSPEFVAVNMNTALMVTGTKDTSVCPGSTLTISASASGGNNGPYYYSWTQHPTLTPVSGSNATVAPTTTMNYFVTVTDNCTTQPARDTIRVSVHALPVVQFTPEEKSGCYPFAVDFANTTPNSLSCTWTYGDGPATGTGFTSSHIYQDPGYYSVTLNVIDNNGCSASATKTNLIYVSGNPIADFITSADSMSILEPGVQLTDMSQSAVAWIWTFDTLGTSTKQNPAYLFPASDTGTYFIQLKVTNEYGCEDSIIKYVKVYPEGTIYLPNAFSPNGDGLNDVFIPVGDHIHREGYSMQIYDRWGNLVFSTSDPSKGWDGRINGSSEAMQEVYVYKITAINSVTNERFPVSFGKVSIVH